MQIKKCVICQHCGTMIEESGTCSCATVVMVENTVVKGTIEVDYRDISPKLLQE